MAVTYDYTSRFLPSPEVCIPHLDINGVTNAIISPEMRDRSNGGISFDARDFELDQFNELVVQNGTATAAGDFNGDGKTDIVVAGTLSSCAHAHWPKDEAMCTRAQCLTRPMSHVSDARNLIAASVRLWSRWP